MLILAVIGSTSSATVTLLSDTVSLNTEAMTNPPDLRYYEGPAYFGVPGYKSVRAYGDMDSYCYSGVGFLNAPSGVVSWVQVNTDWGMAGSQQWFTATADIDWDICVDEQLQIDLSFTTLPGTGGSGSITITDNTTGLAVYSTNLDTTLADSLVLQPGTIYKIDVFMSAGCNQPTNLAELDIAWNASFVPEPMTLMLLGLGMLGLKSKTRNKKED